MRFIATLVLGLVAVVSMAASAPSRLSAATSFCSYGAAFSKGTNILTTPPSQLKTDYAQFKSAQPSMLAAAPKKIKTDLSEVLRFDDGLFTELSKVGWTIAKVPRSVLATWAVQGPKLKPASDKVVSYLDSACGLKLPKP
jgi:hypothetical protein